MRRTAFEGTAFHHRQRHHRPRGFHHWQGCRRVRWWRRQRPTPSPSPRDVVQHAGRPRGPLPQSAVGVDGERVDHEPHPAVRAPGGGSSLWAQLAAAASANLDALASRSTRPRTWTASSTLSPRTTSPAYGDWQQAYIIVDPGGRRRRRTTTTLALGANQRPTGQAGFFAFWRAWVRPGRWRPGDQPPQRHLIR